MSRVGQRAEPGQTHRQGSAAGTESLVGDEAEGVGQEHLLRKSEHKAQSAFRESGRRLVPRRDLTGNRRIPDDRAGDKLRKEGDVKGNPQGFS